MWLDTVRIARDSGDVSSLFPTGVCLRDLPWTLHRAISLALEFLRFQEELPRDEQPSRSIWFNADAMSEHWKMVEAKRKEKYGDTSSSSDDSDMRKNAYLDEMYVK